MKRSSGLLVLAAVLLFASGARASNVRREVSGWYNDGWNAESHASYMANDHLFSEVNPYWYDLGTAEVPTATDGSLSERAYAYTAQNVLDAHANGDLVVPTVADHARGQIDAVLKSPAARKKLLTSIVSTVRSRGYDGIDLDFESGTPAARAQFTAFAGELARALHEDGKRLEVTVRAATSLAEENANMHDYAGLVGAGVDRLKVMAYDHNFDAGTDVPGPVAPLAWTRSALTYAITTRGVPSSKIMLGVHDHGWTWKKTAKSWQLQMPADTYEAVTRRSAATPWQWDATAKESWKEYAFGGKTYRSYVGTADSVAARLGLADELDLAGVAFWVLGREDASIFSRACVHYGASCGAPNVQPALVSAGKPATASSSFDGHYVPAKAVDGDHVEGWLADPKEATSWLRVDLQAVYALAQVKITWGGHDWPKTYDVQTSRDGLAWTTAYHEANNADGGLDTITLQAASARFVRVLCNGPKSDGWSYEIYELEVTGKP